VKRLSLIVVSSVLAVAILFGSLMSQTGTAHAATVSSSPQNFSALVSEIEHYVHVVNHHATVDPQLSAFVTPAQFETVQQAVHTYNTLSPSNAPAPQSLSVSHAASKAVPASSSGGLYCVYIPNWVMDAIAWTITFGGGVAAIVGLVAADTGVGIGVAIAGVILGFGGQYLLWYSDKYWPNGSTWCSDLYGNVYFWAD